MTTIIFLKNTNKKWLDLTGSLVRKLRRDGHNIAVYDASALNYNLGSRENKIPLEKLESFFGGEGASFFSIPAWEVKPLRRLSKVEKEMLEENRTRILGNISSTLKCSSQRAGFLKQVWIRHQISAALRSDSILQEIYANFEDLEGIVLPNGRDLWVKKVANSAISDGLWVKYYEDHNFTGPGRGFFSDRITHERNLIQARAKSLRPDQIIKGSALAWLNQRIEENGSKNLNSKYSPENVFFSTSGYEFEFTGERWTKYGKKSQFDLFSDKLNTLDPTGKKSLVRVHPAEKKASVRSQVILLRNLRALKKKHPYLSIRSQFSDIDSYQLAKNAKTVLVSSSTIGFESYLLGARVLTLGESYFGTLLTTDDSLGGPSKMKKGEDLPDRLITAFHFESYENFSLWKEEAKGPYSNLLFFASKGFLGWAEILFRSKLLSRKFSVMGLAVLVRIFAR